MDLMDLNFWKFAGNNPIHNAQNRFVFVCVDYFSKKVWARPLREKTAISVLNVFKNICQTSHTFPHLLQSDNGLEFNNNLMKDFCQEQAINHIFVKSYTPTSNGLVERMNQEIIKRIRQGFVRFNSLEWVQHLQDYVDGINNHISEATQMTPNHLWTEGYNAPDEDEDVPDEANDEMDMEEKRKLVSGRLIHIAEQRILEGRVHRFVVGNNVRVALKSYQTEVRKMIKENNSKHLVVKYSPRVFSVFHIYPATKIRREHYSLRDDTGALVHYPNGMPLTFYGDELVLVPNNSINAPVQTTLRGNQLNRIRNYPYHP
jgi:hypothetical protein